MPRAIRTRPAAGPALPWLAGAGACAISALVALRADGDVAVVAGCMLVALVCAPLCARLARDPLDAPAIYATVSAACFGVMSLSWLGDVPPVPAPGVAQDDIARALVLVAAGLLAFGVAARLVAGPARPRLPLTGGESQRVPVLLLVGLFAIGALGLLVGLATGALGFNRDAGASAGLLRYSYRVPTLAEPPVGLGYRDISDSDTLSREVARAYGRRVPLWLSEYTIQSDHGSKTFATFVSRASQARYVTAGFELADDLGAAVAGIGWLGLLDEPPAPQSANWGLLTYALARKPAFAAFARAPGHRLRPAVEVAASTTRATLRSRGLRVRVTPRAGGPISVELRRDGRVLASARGRGTAGSASTLRLRSTQRAGRLSVTVRGARGPP